MNRKFLRDISTTQNALICAVKSVVRLSQQLLRSALHRDVFVTGTIYRQGRAREGKDFSLVITFYTDIA